MLFKNMYCDDDQNFMQRPYVKEPILMSSGKDTLPVQVVRNLTLSAEYEVMSWL